MNFLSTAFQLPAAAAGSFVAAPLAVPVSLNQPVSNLFSPVAPTVQQAHKARQMASLATHRAQVLAQRRTAIPTTAKRW